MKRLFRTILSALLLAVLMMALMPISSVRADTLVDSYESGSDEATLYYGNNWVAQTFTASTTYTISNASVKAMRAGTPGTVHVSIRATSGGIPSGADLSTGNTSGDSWSYSTYTWYSINMTSYTIISGIKYAICLRALNGDVSNYFNVQDNNYGTYAGGSAYDSLDNGSSWTIISGVDVLFRVYTSSSGVTTSDATNVLTTTATLQGTLVSLGGSSLCSVSFQYGTSASYGTNTSETEMTAVGNFQASITGLIYNQTYHFRAVSRFGNEYVYGSDKTFSTMAAVGSSTDLIIANVAVFSGFLQSGDLLFCVETINRYTGLYPTQRAGKYFHVQLIDTDNTTVLAASPLSNWGDRPTAIYVNASQAGDLVYSSNYYIKLKGVNVSGTPSTQYQLQNTDWQGNELSSLDDWCRSTASNMQLTDSRSDYLVSLTDRGVLLTDDVGSYFTTGIPSLSTVRPNLFDTSQSSPAFTVGTSVNIWDSLTAWEGYVGSAIVADVNIMAAPFGLTGKDFLAGVIWLVILGMALILTGGGGVGSLGAILVALPLLWLGVWWRIEPVMFVILIVIGAGVLFIRQFIVKTL